MSALPRTPPFAFRARLLSPRDDGGWLDVLDGIVEVDGAGRIGRVGPWPREDAPDGTLDLRPMVVMPGLVDLHAHLPQLPNAGLGSGLDLLAWLDRYIFPLERSYDRSVAERQAPAAWRAFAAAGTTTVVAYAALWEDSTDAAFAAAETHGIRAVILGEKQDFTDQFADALHLFPNPRIALRAHFRRARRHRRNLRRHPDDAQGILQIMDNGASKAADDRQSFRLQDFREKQLIKFPQAMTDLLQ